MSFLDDLLDFGAGALDSVGEHSDWLFGGGSSSNPNTTQQPNHPVVDNNGNTVTTPQGQVTPTTDNKPLWYIGGGLAFLLVLTLVVVLMKGK